MKPKHICKSNFGSDIAFISILMYNLSNLLMYQHVHKYYNRLHNSLCTMYVASKGKRKSLSNVHLKIKIRRRYDLGAHTVYTASSLRGYPRIRTSCIRNCCWLARGGDKAWANRLRRRGAAVVAVAFAAAVSLEVVFLPLAVTS